MKVGLLGDMHGTEFWLSRAIDEFSAAGLDTIIQVGDLGVWPGNVAAAKWDRVDKRLRLAGLTILSAPGNHEDYDQIDALEPRDDGWLPFRGNILLAPRGHRTEKGGRTFVWLGGAASVDRKQRLIADSAFNRQREHYGSSQRRKTWWEQEAITGADVARTAAGGRADVMVSHEAPARVQTIASRLRGNPGGFSKDDLDYADRVRAKYMEAFMAVAPALALHGHYHFAVNEDVDHGSFTTHVFGLSCDGQAYSTGVLDLTTLEPTFTTGRR